MSSQVIKAGLVIGVVGFWVWWWGRMFGNWRRFQRHSRECDWATEMMKKARTIEEVEFYRDQADGAGRWLRRWGNYEA